MWRIDMFPFCTGYTCNNTMYAVDKKLQSVKKCKGPENNFKQDNGFYTIQFSSLYNWSSKENMYVEQIVSFWRNS
jgi:hypothetical protein